MSGPVPFDRAEVSLERPPRPSSTWARGGRRRHRRGRRPSTPPPGACGRHWSSATRLRLGHLVEVPKLVHGGLRYLQQGDVRLVYQALRAPDPAPGAPHLVKILPFLIPIATGKDGLINRSWPRHGLGRGCTTSPAPGSASSTSA